MSDQVLFGRETPRDLELKAAADLEQIPGVLAAAVWIGQAPQVREVYIAAAPGTSIPDLKRATHEVLRANGLVCPSEVIQIGVLDGTMEPPAAEAQPTTPRGETAGPRAEAPAEPPQPAQEAPALEEPGIPPWHGRFFILSGLEVRRAENYVTCRVRLLRVGETLTGEAREIDTPAGRARAAARATVHAVASGARGTALSLEGALLVELFGRQYVAVSVEAATARRSALLSGLVVVERSIEDAACLATLSAVERWLAW
ncbi:MAG TPA: hypothetical protein VIL18_07025 [Longimicrobiales bacterium]